MAFPICPQCHQRVANLMAHACARARKSDGGVEGHAGGITSLIETSQQRDGRSEYPPKAQKGAGLPIVAGEALAGIEPGPSEPQRKRGRPRIGETRDKPWEVLGISSRTWYRRQAEQRAKQ